MTKVTTTNYDLLVLGGGSAGFAAAIRASELGATVGLIEGGTLGGTCVNVGCVPSKTLLRAAEAQYARSHHGFDGVPSSDGLPDWPSVRRGKDELVTRLRQERYQDVLASYPAIHLIRDTARVERGPAVTLESGRPLHAPKLVVATGSAPWAAPIPGLEDAGYLDSTAVMELKERPSTLVVIGGGSVGLELAQMFARLGTAVTVVEREPAILPGEDPEIGAELCRHLVVEGLTVRAGVTIERVERNGEYRIIAGGEAGRQVLTASELLVATGRRPRTSGLGLESAGVGLGATGEIMVDEFLQTSSSGIYAAGDALGDPMYVYVAAYAGAVAAENAVGGDRRKYELVAVPRVTFTDPAVASVGHTLQEARAAGHQAIQSRLPIAYLARAAAARDPRGFVTLVADQKTRRILGAQIVAREAGEMITEPTLAIRHHLTIDDLTTAFHPYLTLSEGIRLAAQGFDRDVDKLSCCAS